MNTSDRPCEPDCGGYADYAAMPCPNPACDERVQRLWESRNTDRPCACPAQSAAPHLVSEHEQDCGRPAARSGLGRCGCWACLAMQVAYHQVIASRGGAA
jgi:hypothetical protein